MKKILFLFILISQLTYSQNDVILKINHLMGTSLMTQTALGTNNLNQDFNLSRIQYYISEISIVHDNNQTTAITNTWLLVNGLENTEINLGSFDIDSVETINYSIGVDAANNHLDPSLYNSNHALAPKSPSMHWGWTSGYRFIAIEGSASGNNFELHVVGDASYTPVSLNYNQTGADNNEVTIEINANYNETMKNLNVVSGFIVHGGETNPEVVTATLNFKESVFSAKESDNVVVVEPTPILDKTNYDLSIYPNPNHGDFKIELNEFEEAIIYNSIGKKIKSIEEKVQNISLNEKGIYFIHFIQKDKTSLVKKVIVQ